MTPLILRVHQIIMAMTLLYTTHRFTQLNHPFLLTMPQKIQPNGKSITPIHPLVFLQSIVGFRQTIQAL